MRDGDLGGVVNELRCIWSVGRNGMWDGMGCRLSWVGGGRAGWGFGFAVRVRRAQAKI